MASYGTKQRWLLIALSCLGLISCSRTSETTPWSVEECENSRYAHWSSHSYLCPDNPFTRWGSIDDFDSTNLYCHQEQSWSLTVDDSWASCVEMPRSVASLLLLPFFVMSFEGHMASFLCPGWCPSLSWLVLNLCRCLSFWSSVILHYLQSFTYSDSYTSRSS